jgi:putative glutamine amidotransferase
MPPLIGITTFRAPNKAGHPLISLMEAYVQSVYQAGGLPVLIPLGLDEAALQALLARLDGLVFSGGGDVNPVHFNGQAHTTVSDVDGDRDRVELYLLFLAMAQRRPFLGICRGLQLINVALGGTLYTHIPDQFPAAIKHNYSSATERRLLAHTVQPVAHTRLAELVGDGELQVNSLHHQGLERPAPGLRIAAHAPDGLVEAFELPEYPFGLAVQWHPEWLQDQAPMRALFRGLVEACQS